MGGREEVQKKASRIHMGRACLLGDAEKSATAGCLHVPIPTFPLPLNKRTRVRALVVARLADDERIYLARRRTPGQLASRRLPAVLHCCRKYLDQHVWKRGYFGCWLVLYHYMLLVPRTAGALALCTCCHRALGGSTWWLRGVLGQVEHRSLRFSATS